MLQREVGAVVGMTGKMNLAVFADDPRRLVDEDRRIEVARTAVFLGEFRIAEAEADFEPGRFLGG